MHIEPPFKAPCPECQTDRKFIVEFHDKEAIIRFECGHTTVRSVLGMWSRSSLDSPVLMFTNYDDFMRKTKSVNKDLMNAHNTVKYRLGIAQYCLELLLENYDNSVAFAAGLTGFLVQAKAALDSLCEVIWLKYTLGPKNRPDYATSAEYLAKNLSKLPKLP